jgi:hypothetical protein
MERQPPDDTDADEYRNPSMPKYFLGYAAFFATLVLFAVFMVLVMKVLR